MAKINISINDDLLKRVDGYSARNYMSRSGTVAMALTHLVGSDELMAAIKSMSVAMKKIAEKGEIDEETQKQLEDFERVSRIIGGAR